MKGLTRVIRIILVMVLANGLEAKTCNTYLSTLNNKSVFKYGEIIQFRCIVYNASTIDKSELSLINKQTNVSVSFRNISGNTSYAEIEVLNLNFTGQYSCRYDDCTRDSLLSVIHISVDPCSIPGQYETRPNISCIVNDLSTMACHWSTMKTVDHCGSWHIMYTTTLIEHYYCCADHVVTTSVDACAQSGPSCVIPADELLIGFTYTFVLSRVTSEGQEVYNYTMFSGNNIVKIGIDDDVSVYSGSSPRDLHVTFTVHHSPASVQGLTCKLTYTSQYGDYKTFAVNIQNISLDITVNLHHLNPYTVYTVNIMCKPTTSQYWSNRVTGSGMTQSMVPDSIPNLIGYSVVMTSLNLTQIYLYLKTVPMYDWYDKELRYVVTIDDENVHVVDKYDGNTITAVLTHQVSANKIYLVQVRSENNAGESSMVKYLNLLTNHNKGTFVALENTAIGSIVTIFPGDGNNITGLTYFRCQGQPDLYPPVCQTDLENHTISRFMHTFLWQQERTNVVTYAWYYGVTIHRQGENFNNRILWSDCVFQENSETRDTSLDVSAVYDDANSSVAIVTLHFSYCDLRHKPSHYLVGVWNCETNVTDYCSQQHPEFQSFTASPFIYELNVSLYHLTNPCFCVRVQYEDDFDVSVDMTPQYSAFRDSQIATSVKTINSAQVIAAVIGSISASFVFVIIILKIRKFRLQQLKNNRIPPHVMKNILENAPEIIEQNHQYTIVVEEVNSSGYESLQINSSKPGQFNSSGPLFEDSAEADQYKPIDDASTCDTSNSGPAVIYSPIRHGEANVNSGNSMVDKSDDSSHRIETGYDDSSDNIPDGDEASIINYTQLQVGGVYEGDNCKDYEETPSDGSKTHVQVIEKNFENDETDKNIEVLNYIQVANEHEEENNYCECTEGTDKNVAGDNFRLALHAQNVEINDYKDKIAINENIPSLNYAQLSRSTDSEIVDVKDEIENTLTLNYIRVSHESEEDSDFEIVINEEKRYLDDENTLNTDSDNKEHSVNITLDTDDDVSVSLSEIINATTTPTTSDSDTSLSDDDDTDDDDDDGIIDSYSQLTTPNEIPRGYAIGHIINSSS